MQKKFVQFSKIFILLLAVIYVTPILLPDVYFRNFAILRNEIEYLFSKVILGDTTVLIIITVVAAVVILYVCQKRERDKLERETDFIQAEHLCKSGDKNMQGYADAAEKRAQAQKRLSVEVYGKRAPQSKYYNKR